MNQQKVRFLREPQVFDITKLSKSTRWRLEKDGKFPRRRQISSNAVAWLEHEILDWMSSRELAAGDLK